MLRVFSVGFFALAFGIVDLCILLLCSERSFARALLTALPIIYSCSSELFMCEIFFPYPEFSFGFSLFAVTLCLRSAPNLLHILIRVI